jgi:hypothetical protein
MLRANGLVSLARLEQTTVSLAASTTVNSSLPEVHSSVPTAQPALWRRMLAFAGTANARHFELIPGLNVIQL